MTQNLLTASKKGRFKWAQSHTSQLIQMLNEYKRLGFFKNNIAQSNLLVNYNTGELKAIDFKWAKPRLKAHLAEEIFFCHKYLRKVDKSLPREIVLSSAFSDFSLSQRKKIIDRLEKQTS